MRSLYLAIERQRFSSQSLTIKIQMICMTANYGSGMEAFFLRSIETCFNLHAKNQQNKVMGIASSCLPQY